MSIKINKIKTVEDKKVWIYSNPPETKPGIQIILVNKVIFTSRKKIWYAWHLQPTL